MPTIPLFKVFMAEGSETALAPTLQSGFIGQGPQVEAFEKELQTLFQSPLVNTTNSATSAIHLALNLVSEYADQHRNQVITTPLTCTATNIPILHNGLAPVWADIDPLTCNIDPEDIHRKITPNTLAVMAVHWAGNPVHLAKINDILDHHEAKNHFRPFLIEDCAQAITARSHQGHNSFAAYSFGPIKHLTTGDGGALLTPHNYFHDKAKLLRWYGLDRQSSHDFRCQQLINYPGFKFHMNDINATLGLHNLPHLHTIVGKHQSNANYLRQNLHTVTHVPVEQNSVDWVLTIHVQNRTEFMLYLQQHGIQSSRVHDRNDKHPIFQPFTADLPNTTRACDTMVAIPCGWWLTPDDLDHITHILNAGDWHVR